MRPQSIELRDELTREWTALRTALRGELRAALAAETAEAAQQQAVEPGNGSASGGGGSGGRGWFAGWFRRSLDSDTAPAAGCQRRHSTASIRAGQHPGFAHAVAAVERLTKEYNAAVLSDKESFGAFWPLDQAKQASRARQAVQCGTGGLFGFGVLRPILKIAHT